MAVRAAIANGNFLTAGTWGVVDATSYLNSESAATTITTSFVESSTFTPGAITVDGIGIKVSNRTGTTGTISVHLAIAGVEVTGTLVTINMSDLPAIVTADINGGWSFFKFAAPVLLVGATLYSVGIKTSSSSQANVYSSATSNWSRYLRTTTTGAPAAADDLIITGDYLSAGSTVTVTVTMDALAGAITDYGAASTSQVTPSLAISQGGSLVYGATAATAYYLRQSGCVVVYINGTLSLGTTGTPIPRDSSAILNFDCGANVDFGLIVRNGGTFNAQGLSRTSGKNVVSCLLNTDEAINQTTLGVDTDTGWLDNDVIAVASTTQTAAQCEQGTLNGAAGASSLTVDGFGGVGGGVAFAHSGTSPTQAEVILLTRNVQIFGASASLAAYIDIKALAVVDCDWAEFKWLGSATALKRGIDIATTTGTCSFQFCSRHTSTVTSSYGWNVLGTTGSGVTISNNVTFNVANFHLQVAATTGVPVVSTNVFMRNTDAVVLVQLTDLGTTFTTNTLVGAGASGMLLSEAAGALGTFSGTVSHSNVSLGINQSGACGNSATLSTMATTTLWRNLGGGVQFGNMFTNLLVSGLTLFGNASANIVFGTIGYNRMTFDAVVSSSDTTFLTASGINLGSSTAGFSLVVFENSTFGVASGIKVAHTQDVNVLGLSGQVIFRNTIFASPTEILNQVVMYRGATIAAQKHDQVAGNHKTWKREGTIAIETGTVHTGAQAFSMTPNSSATATTKLESPSFFAAVANGAAVTPTVYIQKSAAYNGNQPRLVVKKNVPLGIAADAVLATYASGTGSWNSISGATAAVTDDGVLEFVVDCDYGTGGVIYADSFSVANASNPAGQMQFWHDGAPASWVDPVAAGGQGVSQGLHGIETGIAA